jgi:hypothetical protein
VADPLDRAFFEQLAQQELDVDHFHAGGGGDIARAQRLAGFIDRL